MQMMQRLRAGSNRPLLRVQHHSHHHDDDHHHLRHRSHPPGKIYFDIHAFAFAHTLLWKRAKPKCVALWRLDGATVVPLPLKAKLVSTSRVLHSSNPVEIMELDNNLSGRDIRNGNHFDCLLGRLAAVVFLM